MSYEVIARKWRPQVFEDVVGQAHVTRTLVNAIKADRIAHAYLFCGPRGVGKTTVARILAKAINCEEGEPGIPCNRCPSCLDITKGVSVDVQEIDGASNRRIEEIRELREHVRYTPSSSKYRVYIIDEVHMLTKEAFNALLKTLEEPPSHAKFIFATTEIRKIPATILSRCQRFDFKRIPPLEISAHLRKIAEHEGVKISDTGLRLIALEADGSMRDAQSLFDQAISFCGEEVDDQELIDILGIIDREVLLEAVHAILEGSSKRCLEIVGRLYGKGYDIKDFYRALTNQFRDILMYRMGIETDSFLIDPSGREKLDLLSDKMSMEKLQYVMNFLVNREQDMLSTSSPRLLMETLLIRLCHLDQVFSFDHIIKKIEELEKNSFSFPLSPDDRNETNDAGTTPLEYMGGNAQSGIELNNAHATGPGPENRGMPSWNDFISHVLTENHPMASVLKSMELVSLDGRRLEIACEEESFPASYFEDRERYELLCHYCKGFFKRDLDVKIVQKKKKGVLKEDRKSKEVDLSVYPEAVQQIVTMFDGKIETGDLDLAGS